MGSDRKSKKRRSPTSSSDEDEGKTKKRRSSETKSDKKERKHKSRKSSSTKGFKQMADSTSASMESSANAELKRRSNDVGWEYGVVIDANRLDKVKCILCGKVMCGGIYRLKQHIAHVTGNVSACPKSTKEDQMKCKAALNKCKTKKKGKKAEDVTLRSDVRVGRSVDESCEAIDIDEMEESLGSMKPIRTLGPIDKFASPSNSEDSLKLGKNEQERLAHVKEYVCRWAYECVIPFHAFEKDSFKVLMEACGQFGRGAQPPTRYEMGETYLKKEVERTKSLLKPYQDEWKQIGCSIMIDAWFDRERRSIMNLCVNSKSGTVFLSFKESSADAHTSQHIYEYVEQCILEVGPENVVQIVTNNASNNMRAAKLLKEKRPIVFWTSCATHTLNVMLEGIGGLPRYKKILDQAKSLTVFIYAHHKTLALMRTFTKKRDIVRPGVTKFASAFLTLQSLARKKVELRHMFSSTKWEECKFSKTVKGKAAYATVMSSGFWSGVTTCLRVFAPLVKVFRMVDGDAKPSMGFVYGEILKARKDIMDVLNNSKKAYKPILDIISEKMTGRLDSQLHLTAYLLNPYYHFQDPDLKYDPEVMDAVLEFCDTMFPGDEDMQNQILSVELAKYKNKEDWFGKPIAAKACEVNDDKFDPANWWGIFGVTTPNLTKIAIRILSLTTSSSRCERNWSTFEGVHTKKRNRLETTKLNNLVFVQFNANLMNKNKKSKEKNMEVLLASDATEAQDWLVDEDEVEPRLTYKMVSDALGADEFGMPRRSCRTRELFEEEFESESEDEANEEDEYESDEARILDQDAEDNELPTTS